MKGASNLYKCGGAVVGHEKQRRDNGEKREKVLKYNSL